MTKRSCIGLLILATGALTLAGSAHGLGFLEFQQAFGRKGSGGGGFSSEISLAFDSEGSVYVSDAKNRVIQKLGADGTPVFQYPAPGAEDLPVVLVKPGDIAVDMAGNIYVADTTAVVIPDEELAGPPVYIYTPCVHKFDGAGAFVTTLAIDSPTALPKSSPVIPVKQILTNDGRLALAIQPSSHDRGVEIALDRQGNLFILDAERDSKQVVYKHSPDGEREETFGRYGAGDGEFDGPKDIVVGADGGVFVADTGNHRIVKFDNDGQFELAFASEGLGGSEVTAPHYLAATMDSQLVVKDDSAFVRKELRSVPLEVLSLSAFSSGQRSFRELSSNSSLSPLSDTDELARRMRRLEELTLLDESDGDSKAMTDKALQEAVRIQNTLYHKVIHRVQRFGVDGSYSDSSQYRLDQMDEDLHDLTFVGADLAGNIYLQDGSDFSLRRYGLSGFSLRASEVDAISSTQFMNQTNDILEDYEDIDQKPDNTQDETTFNGRQRLLFNYDLSDRWNLLVENASTLRNRDGDQVYPERLENSITFEDRNWDNDLYLGVNRVVNPNPYDYKEFNLFVQRQDGSSRLDTDALFPELNLQAGRQEGDSSGTMFGLDWDILRDANLYVQYQTLDPSDTSRNYTREFFDLEGNLYQVLRTQNKSDVFIGELNIKF
ncbi:hypothetical protein CMK11_05830 [Candidatus Poribacteria bacterium]|nr:hypothetical protein [Candidatus Poribacteria bacterium]